MPGSATIGSMLSARAILESTLTELGAERDNLWVLTPDIGSGVLSFRERFPTRFVDVGLAEQACVGIAAGLAYDGNIPVVSGMLPFLSMRALEQVRTDVCYPNLPVKIVGTYGGLVGNAGSTHYAVEDLSLMCSLTNLTVTSIGDPLMVGEVLRQSMDMAGPLYLRLGQGKKDPVLYDEQQEIRIGTGIVARDGSDVTLFAHGVMVAQALTAAGQLADDGISVRVVDMFTLKPIDIDLVVRCAEETGGRFVVLEDHLAFGGLASRIADVVADQRIHLASFERLGIPQVYAGFGQAVELWDKHGYGLDATMHALRRAAAA